LPKVGGERVAAFEVMGTNLQVKDLIVNGETEDRTFYNTIVSLTAFGMQTFDQSILSLYEQGLITEETAMAYASKKAIVGRGIDTKKAEKGEKTTDIEGLSLDESYGKTAREREKSRYNR
jgi:twitching motility protein PilT